MAILTDKGIRKIAQNEDAIVQFIPRTIRAGLSYGLSSVGYDVRLSPTEFLLIDGDPCKAIDPKRFDPADLTPLPLIKQGSEQWFVLPAHRSALGVTVEEFAIPNGMMAITYPKSTYGRAGLFLNTIPAEPGWKGYLTLEFANLTHRPLKVYANEGIGQMVFCQAAGLPELTYADRSGKYQGQGNRPTPARAIAPEPAMAIADDGIHGDL